ncbi:EVI5-like protein isoform X1 [Alligator mississippiensis]|nr:EVI5-like protein isoform X1 [Alligator mississippiensis]XP_059588357.1 EVI5-like protein isoform X1 [Alligator mississippiensis]XP_059588358.1 EVI5-like protein isoform X1 [Alligator mississippiensis]XP_059588359.1 EVI5-like protein isoform X1 [Alligator mississippiensis]XP_059588360.1 EVI5-like protein isoform X1 [Alligator mississippiensis]XP_059588361.1 EVI5-like protein isoform X1 [Alligator mississippiensis]XP_059588362.1 EVI5-like protein isoform X1 [Alligator mississippiensis]XP_0
MNVPVTLSLPEMASPAVSPDSSSHEALSSVNSAPACSPTSDSENLSPDELELLAKLEEQNRLLEADSKSMRSMNGSRRNSGSSLVSSSSASSNLSHLEEDTWILWGRIVNEWDEWRKKKEKLLKELIRKGIPHHFRAIVWQLLCSATDMPVKNQYSELLKMSSPCEKLIRRDIARTYPEHEFFKGQDSLGQEVLFNVMKAYSLVDREVGYCQGSAFIVGLLLMQMPEEEAFCVFVRLMQEYRLRELFKPSMAELGLCIYQFEYMLQEQLPELNIHFRSQSFLTSMYASSWFLTLFLTTFPLPVATRVFDIFMYEGLEIIFRVGMALLQFNQAELIQLDMEGMSQHFQKVIPHQFDSCPDKLILRAYQVKYNPKKMKRLEKEYAAIKNKEMEEQIEIKRLRTENRLLKQRIETLEKGQVTRAQEAEENYIIKRELAVVKQQCSSATENLQKAQSTIRQLQDQQGNPRFTEEFVTHLETELEQSRLRESETLSALKEMQDKVLDMEKKHSLLPDENNVARLQEELKALTVREAEALAGLRDLQQHIKDLSDSWQAHVTRTSGRWKESPRKAALGELQDELMGTRLREAQAQAELHRLRQRVVELETQDQIHSSLLTRTEQACAGLQEKLQYITAQNKGLQTQLSETKRKHAESECKSKEEVMAVRLREADSMAAVAEMRQRIAELEIQREEGMIQGQLNNSDSSQYIRELKDQIDELKAEIRLMKGPKPFEDSMAFDGIHIVSHLAVDDDSLHSSDEELLASPMGVGALQDVLYPLSPRNTRFLRGAGSSGKESSTDSEPEEPATAPGLQPPLLFGEALGK